MSKSKTDITIVGAGPVGLYLAGLLMQTGFSCTVLEQKTEIDLHSKSLGIHPVSLELFDEAGIIEPFLNAGLKIKKGIAFWNRNRIGEITFDRCPEPHNYILSIPQWRTEQILEEWVISIDSNALIRGAEVVSFEEHEQEVTVCYKKDHQEYQITSKYLIGCDGKNSVVREKLQIPFEGSPYPDSYIMGDFSDNTTFKSDAVVYLHEEGLIESFLLPNGHRRWVVKTDTYIEKPEKKLLTDLVNDRLSHSLEGCENYMMSSFGVQHLLAKTFHSGRFLLAGDAAHVVSPIGGQGMNLGWIGAAHCANALKAAIFNKRNEHQPFENYSNSHRKIAKQVAKRAEINMHLGRKETSTPIYKAGVYLLIKTGLSHTLAKIFTMRGLGKWII